MHRVVVAIVLGLAVLCAPSCAHPPASGSARAYNKPVQIAVIDPERAVHVVKILKRAGIECFTYGSVGYGVFVLPGTESRAVSLLRADAARQKYYIEFQ